MLYYNIIDEPGKYTHTISITLQYREFKGHIGYSVSGECVGLSVLDINFNYDEFDISSFTENDCNFGYDDVNDCWYAQLTSDDGRTCRIVIDGKEEAEKYVVGVKITKCEVDKFR